MTRTQAEINQEYSFCASHLGDRIFKKKLSLDGIEILEKEITDLKDQMKKLMDEKSVESMTAQISASDKSEPPVSNDMSA